MYAADELVDQIVNSSQIPSGKRRQEIQRELRSHIEDLVEAARETGRDDDEIKKMVVASFGDPAQIAGAFAWVYRRERAIMRVCMFLLSSLAVTSLMLPPILALQAGIAIGFGTSVSNVLASPHTVIETLDVLFTITTYTGLVALEELFERNRSFKALALLVLAFAVLMGGCATVGFRVRFLVFGLVNGSFFRTCQVFIKSGTARTGIVVAGLALFGLISFEVMPFRFHHALMATGASWLVMGAAYRQMPDVVSRIDAALFQCLQRI
ncbi:MAG: hypothetical protein C5B51_04950 [Terriglobia bacterium]|nr:MAG: hypothetical protein C5B51_04950 [Terriglobia bacterium]